MFFRISIPDPKKPEILFWPKSELPGIFGRNSGMNFPTRKVRISTQKPKPDRCSPLSVRLVGGTKHNSQEQGLVSHVWCGLRWNKTKLTTTHVEQACSTKIHGTQWNKPIIYLNTLHLFHQHSVFIASPPASLPPPPLLLPL